MKNPKEYAPDKNIHSTTRDEAREHRRRDELHQAADAEKGHATQEDGRTKGDDGAHLAAHVGVVLGLFVEDGVLVLLCQRDTQRGEGLGHEEGDQGHWTERELPGRPKERVDVASNGGGVEAVDGGQGGEGGVGHALRH